MIWAVEVRKGGDVQKHLDEAIEKFKTDFSNLDDAGVRKFFEQGERFLLTFGPDMRVTTGERGRTTSGA